MVTPADERTVEWYRPVLLGRLVLVWLVGVVLIGTGVVLSALSFDLTGRFLPRFQAITLFSGILCTISGSLVGLLGILRVLSADPVWLVIRLDGVVFRTEDEEVMIPW
ncbi:MAG: hypothetical protein ACI8S6_006060, partial [Myxococcota bacterium]